jgi:hypothetical protein
MPESIGRANWIFGVVGAVAGGALGFFAFQLLTREGFYGLLLPGAALGLGCGALSGGKSNGLAALCCVLAALLGIITEWWFFPFMADGSLLYFAAHLQDLRITTLVSIAAGALFGFWFGRGREGGVWPRRKAKA